MTSKKQKRKPTTLDEVRKSDKVIIKLVGYGLTSYEHDHVVERVSKGNIYVEGLDFPFDQNTGAGLSDLGLSQWLVLEEGKSPIKVIEKPKTLHKQNPSTLKVGDEISVKLEYNSGRTYYDFGTVFDIMDEKVYISDGYDRMFDLETGKMERSKYKEDMTLSLIYDYGYLAQHEEDVALGEGETL